MLSLSQCELKDAAVPAEIFHDCLHPWYVENGRNGRTDEGLCSKDFSQGESYGSRARVMQGPLWRFRVGVEPRLIANLMK